MALVEAVRLWLLRVSVAAATIAEVRVAACLFRRDAAGLIVDQEPVEQIQPIVIQSRYERLCVVALPLRERGFEVGEGLHAGPFVFGGSTKDTVELLRKKNLDLLT